MSNKRFKTYMEVKQIIQDSDNKPFNKYYQKELEKIVTEQGLNIVSIRESRYDNNIINHIYTNNTFQELMEKKEQIRRQEEKIKKKDNCNYFFTLS